jgi:hypothetical protein
VTRSTPRSNGWRSPDVPTPYNVILMNAVLPQVDEIAAQMTELIEF